MIKDTSKTERPIRDTSKTEKPVDPNRVAQILGAKIVGNTGNSTHGLPVPPQVIDRQSNMSQNKEKEKEKGHSAD